MSWTSQKARELCDRILSFSKTRECELSLALEQAGHTRFAANEVTTAGMASTVRIQITSREEGRSGSTTTDALDDSVLREAVERSEALMVASRPDPEQVEGLGPQHYPEIPAYDEATALASPVLRRDGVWPALDRARERGLNASGFFENSFSFAAIANKKGNFGFHRLTRAAYSVTMRTSDGTGSGYAAFASPRVADIDAPALATQAAAKAETSAHPRELPPGRYTVILEPEAVADLLMWMVFSMNARSVDEGRSFLSKPGGGSRVGEKVFADAVTLRSDPFDRRNPGNPWAWDSGGFAAPAVLPARRTTWIENGVVRTIPVDRYWAQKTKVEPVPFSGGFNMEGSDKSLDALVSETARALLVSRFWYIRFVNPLNVTVTGLTRDGVWLVEKGKIVHPVNNFRFNDSPVNLLKNLEATSKPVRAGGMRFGSMIAPAIRARDFHFTSKSDAI
jgi:predicted Zn-dependent protease